MRAPGVVVLAPALDDGLRFGEAVEDFAVQKLVTQLRVEALAIAIFPRRARLDEGRLRSNGCDPVPNRFGDEIRAIVGTQMTRPAAQD